jgi:hypothetical protein
MAEVMVQGEEKQVEVTITAPTLLPASQQHMLLL